MAYAFAFSLAPRSLLPLSFDDDDPFAIVIPLYLIIRDLHWFNTYQSVVPRRMPSPSCSAPGFITVPRITLMPHA
jgi:ABC-type glycerol-3-phosphate transport system permease component